MPGTHTDHAKRAHSAFDDVASSAPIEERTHFSPALLASFTTHYNPTTPAEALRAFRIVTLRAATSMRRLHTVMRELHRLQADHRKQEKSETNPLRPVRMGRETKPLPYPTAARWKEAIHSPTLERHSTRGNEPIAHEHHTARNEATTPAHDVVRNEPNTQPLPAPPHAILNAPPPQFPTSTALDAALQSGTTAAQPVSPSRTNPFHCSCPAAPYLVHRYGAFFAVAAVSNRPQPAPSLPPGRSRRIVSPTPPLGV